MILERFRLDGKVALVTGASRGIGLGIAKALAEAGAQVVASSRTPRPEAIAEIEAAGGGRKVHYMQADMENLAAPGALITSVVEQVGRLDVLVNNAGVAKHGETDAFAWADYRRLMTINLDSLFLSCQAALEPMRAAGGGVILNIGSISGLISNVPQPQAAYNASKAAVHMLTKSLASDYAEAGIRVNAIAPGYIDTDMTAGGLADPVWGPVWREMTPMHRAGTVEEIAAGALFLCSPASSYVTGEVMVIDGGYTTR
ncbi:MAG: SDR family oxidoreductase [Rhodocyclaceae bacterium]|nr:SDR family oxidoreductase [Rhodocyclaceae bacterium]